MSDLPLCRALLVDAFGRVAEEMPALVAGLTVEQLRWAPGPAANPIGWLVWHLTRVQDDHVAGVAGREQVWETQGFRTRFACPYAAHAIGYGHTPEEVRAFHVSDPQLLVDYHAAVHAFTVEVLQAMTEEDFARVVDARWDPPVTAAVRLVSVVNDTTQHLGQAAYVRGLLLSG